jgi:hypothetical protein
VIVGYEVGAVLGAGGKGEEQGAEEDGKDSRHELFPNIENEFQFQLPGLG